MNRLSFSDSDERLSGEVHPPDGALQALTEGTLRGEEQSRVVSHVASCPRCTGEVEDYRMVMTALSELPRFAPSADFSEAVMARVKVAPEPNPLVARIMSWLPSTHRGWSWFALAFLLPLAALAGLGAWLSSQLVVSPGLALQWTAIRVSTEVADVATRSAEWIGARQLWALAERGFAASASLPPELLVVAAVLFVVAIPASGWLLVRLLHTPIGDRSHA